MKTGLKSGRKSRLRRLLTISPVTLAYAGAFVAVAFGATVSFGASSATLPYASASVLFLVASVAALVGGLETSRRFRRAHRTLLCYVPEAVARRILRGHEPASGECDVSVLFVDIRDYTSRVEESTPEQIHALLGRYTLAVSTIIERHGGSVVEFGGDGMMAVFGAPDPLADKERASVEAARAIADTVGALVRSESDSDAGRIEVGIGVASGPAFTGIIPAADRLVWSAVGNTTNLASRLQGLTRDLSVPIAIDETTWSRLGDVDAAFEPHFDVAIRGRTRGENVYTLSPDEVAVAAPAVSVPCIELAAGIGQAA